MISVMVGHLLPTTKLVLSFRCSQPVKRRADLSEETVELNLLDARKLALRACKGVGADSRTASSLVDATISAAIIGPIALGFPHFVDYLHSFEAGRINPAPQPKLFRPLPAFINSDADKGIAQLGFDLAFPEIVQTARLYGIAVFAQSNSYPAGELGYYVRRMANAGLIAFGFTNANAMVAPYAGAPKIYSTNPMAFAYPLGEEHPPLVIDQSSGATAYINIAAAAAEGREIPAGWAVDSNGRDTTDAREAVAGALLPFGGRKGANVALLVEMLSAGLTGSSWSVDAPNFNSGNQCPAVGMTIFALVTNPAMANASERARAHTCRLREAGVYIPGIRVRTH